MTIPYVDTKTDVLTKAGHTAAKLVTDSADP